MTDSQPKSNPTRLVSRTELARALGVSDMAAWRLVRRGALPPPVILSPRVYRYDLDACLRAIGHIA